MAKRGVLFGVAKPENCDFGIRLGPIVNVSVNLTKSNSQDWGDNEVQDNDELVTGGTVTIEMTHDSLGYLPVGADGTISEAVQNIGPGNASIYKALLGHDVTLDLDNNKVIGISKYFYKDDVAPVCKVGFMGYSTNEGWYVAKVYPEVRFSEPNDENRTKTENITYGHIILTGELLIPKNGKWRTIARTALAEDLKDWLYRQFSVNTTLFPKDWTSVSAGGGE